MHKSEEYRNRIELLQGTLDLIILQTLRWGPQHGYGICRRYGIAVSRFAPLGETGFRQIRLGCDG
jgi:hypothetical protein